MVLGKRDWLSHKSYPIYDSELFFLLQLKFSFARYFGLAGVKESNEAEVIAVKEALTILKGKFIRRLIIEVI